MLKPSADIARDTDTVVPPLPLLLTILSHDYSLPHVMLAFRIGTQIAGEILQGLEGTSRMHQLVDIVCGLGGRVTVTVTGGRFQCVVLFFGSDGGGRVEDPFGAAVVVFD